jgi:outer membrane protein insertion porin family
MYRLNLQFVRFLLFGWVFFMTLGFSAFVYADNNLISQIVINIDDEELRQSVLRLILLKEGNEFSEEQLDESIDLLKKWGRFESVDIQKEPSSDGLRVILNLTPGLVISAIDFSGHFPYLTKRIRRNVGIRVGQIFHREDVIDEVKKIKSFFKREGYFGTVVHVRENINAANNSASLVFKINKGQQLRWRNIEVEGNSVFPDGFFKSKINSWFAYKPSRLRNSLTKVKRAYKKKGYPRLRIRIKKIFHDFENKSADIILEVSEYKKVSVRFYGNRLIRKKTLRQTVTFFTEEAYDTYEIEQSVLAIKALYATKGFLNVRVRAEKEVLSETEWLINFRIDEGQQTLVKKIKFTGERDLDERKLKNSLELKEAGFFEAGYLSKPALLKAEKYIPRLLQRQGFVGAQFLETHIDLNQWHDRAIVNFVLETGVQSTITGIRFPGLINIEEKKLRDLIQLKKGEYFNVLMMHEDVLRLQAFFADNGYPYAAIDPTEIVDPDTGDTIVIFAINEGPLVKVSEILIIGIDKTRISTIRSAIPIKAGEIYSYKKILDGESVLRSLGAYASVNITALGLEAKKDKVALLANIEEHKHLEFAAKASFDTDDNVSGVFSFTNLDLFGFGKRMHLELEAGFDTKHGEWNYIDPRLLASKFEMIFSIFTTDQKRPSFNETEIGSSVALIRNIGSKMRALAKYEVRRSIFRGGTPSPDSETTDRTLPETTLSLNYDSRDYFADPRSGLVALSSLHYFNPIFGAGANFFRLKGQYAYYGSPVRRLTVKTALDIERIITVTSGTIVPRSELLFIGGDYSIRGFGQDQAGPKNATGTPLGQRYSLFLSNEIQLRIVAGIKFVGFVDNAISAQNFSLSSRALRHTAGFGLRYITPVGPIRLDYGIKLDPVDGEDFGRVHVAFGYAF